MPLAIPADVDAQDPLPVVVGRLPYQTAGEHPGVVAQQSDGSKLVGDVGRQRFDRGAVGDVERDTFGLGRRRGLISPPAPWLAPSMSAAITIAPRASA